MQVTKINAFSVQTALMHKTVFWVQQQKGCHVSCHLPKGEKPLHTNLALG